METSSIVVLIIVAVVAFLVWKEQGSKKTQTSKPVVTADRNNNGVVSKAELGKLTKGQLFDFAEKRSLKVKKSGNKAAVISEIHSQLK
jgi:Flp pilus assembly protein TadB